MVKMAKNLHMKIVFTFMCVTHICMWGPLLKKQKNK